MTTSAPSPPRVARAAPAVRTGLILGVLGVLLTAAMTLAVGTGSVPIGPAESWSVVAGRLHGEPVASRADAIVWDIRLPRVLLAALVGAALTTVGTVMQTLVRNPLADPFLLGVSSGASVGATAVMMFGALTGLGVWALSGGAVLGAAAATSLVFGLAQRAGRLDPHELVLTGVVLSAMFSAICSFLLFQGSPQAGQAVLYWLLGSFGSATWAQLPLPALVLAVVGAVLVVLGRPLDALAAGPDLAASLGIDVERLRRLLFALTSLVAGVAVAVSGVIGFVGLVVPHVARLLVGSAHRRLLPVGMLLGALLTVVGDLLARVLAAPQEMPMGVVTSFVGAPVLLVLLRRRGRDGAGAA